MGIPLRNAAATLGVVALLLGGCSNSAPRKVLLPLTLDDVLRLHNAGVGAKAITAKIETCGIAVQQMSLDDIIALKKAGLSDEVLAEVIRAAEGPPKEERRNVVVHEYRTDPYYYRGPVYAPYWW